MNFEKELKIYQDIVNAELEVELNFKNELEEKLVEAMNYSLLAGGKRIRPILVLKTYELFGNDMSSVIPYALALEMVHNFSLIHDDLPGIDNDDFRHGKLTNHKKFSEATAILAGDGLLNTAYILISKDISNSKAFELSRKVEVFKEFAYAIDRMIAGEFIDTEEEGKNVSNETLEYIHQNKTGALITLAVRMGAKLGGCEEQSLRHLTSYSEKIGLAFQIKDDILSVEGDSSKTGKPVGNDEKMQKNTYVSMYGLEKAKEMLDNIVDDAIFELRYFDSKADFLRDLAIYIKEREK